jgi:hypothetical protein
MMTPVPAPIDSGKVWRYTSFSRFVWLLQKKQLWLSRADLLGDPWEITLAGDQLAHVISRHPPTDIFSEVVPEPVMQRTERIINLWRREAFVSCWNASEHESHALWRIYCPSVEGVAMQTTLARLRESVGDLPMYPVTYETPGAHKQTPTRQDLVTKKRPMFAYEREVRVVLTSGEDAQPETLGRCIEWDPEKILESIRVHPGADPSFMETVTATVQHYAPSLGGCVEWSAMRALPPF